MGHHIERACMRQELRKRNPEEEIGGRGRKAK
jgi:hypothetical protein